MSKIIEYMLGEIMVTVVTFSLVILYLTIFSKLLTPFMLDRTIYSDNSVSVYRTIKVIIFGR